MKILRFNEGRWGVLEGELVLETDGPGGNPTGRRYDLASVTLLPPATPTKIVCVGRNYREHIREMGHDFGEDLPKEPGLFLKGPNALARPGNPRDPWGTAEPVPYPFFTEELHYEGELAVVVGDRMRHVPPEKALDHVLGYTVAVDITARIEAEHDFTEGNLVEGDGVGGFDLEAHDWRKGGAGQKTRPRWRGQSPTRLKLGQKRGKQRLKVWRPC